VSNENTWIDFIDHQPIYYETIDVLVQYVDQNGVKRLKRMVNCTWVGDRVICYQGAGPAMVVTNAVYWMVVNLNMPTK